MRLRMRQGKFLLTRWGRVALNCKAGVSCGGRLRYERAGRAHGRREPEHLFPRLERKRYELYKIGKRKNPGGVKRFQARSTKASRI